MIKTNFTRVAIALTVGLAVLSNAGHAMARQRLTVLLDRFVNPNHGPLVIAQEKGMFQAAGLDVFLIESADPSTPPGLVAAGKAEIAVSRQPQLHMRAAEGMPLVRIATMVATPLNSLVVAGDGPVRTIADLKGRKIGYPTGGLEESLLARMLENHGLKPDDVELVDVNSSLSPSDWSGQLDGVIGAFRNFELNRMDIEGHPGRAFYPEEEGVPAYDELILVTNAKLVGEPALRKFVDVLEEATRFIVNHPDEAWEIFRASDPARLGDELNRRAWRDTVPRFALRPGALDVSRYARFAAFLQERGLVKELPKLETYAVELK